MTRLRKAAARALRGAAQRLDPRPDVHGRWTPRGDVQVMFRGSAVMLIEKRR